MSAGEGVKREREGEGKGFSRTIFVQAHDKYLSPFGGVFGGVGELDSCGDHGSVFVKEHFLDPSTHTLVSIKRR